METPELPTQEQSDVNKQIADRIDLINTVFKGGLGEFFEKLRKDRHDGEFGLILDEGLVRRRLSETIHCKDASPGAHS